MTQRFCIHCRFFQPNPSDMVISRCGLGRTTNLVTGESKFIYCEVARGTGGKCGPEGKLFESAGTVPA